MTEKTNPDSSDDVPHLSAYAGTMDFMVPYIQAGGPPSQQDTDGNTILHAAVDGWQHRMVEFLILSGADINAQNKNGATPLHQIVRSHHIPFKGKFLREISPEDARKKTFRMLIRHGVDTSIQNIQGANALHLAAHSGDIIAIDELLIGGMMAVDAVNSKGATALLIAILQEQVACVKRLIAIGADVNFQLDNTTPLRLLLSSDNTAMRDLYNETKKRLKAEQYAERNK